MLKNQSNTMQEITKELMELGLTHGESKVYLALLELGSSTVGPIVKKANVAYSNVYEILNRLLEKGLVAFIIKNETKYFQATNPRNLSDYLERKEKEINRQKRVLAELLPKLEGEKVKPEEEAEIFVGLKGLKAAYIRLFTENPVGGENLFFYIHRKEYAKESDKFYISNAKLFRMPRIVMRGISNEEYRDSKAIVPTTKMRYVNFPIPGNIEIFQDKILVLAWSEKPVSFLIRSKQIANIMKEYFESVWKIAKK